jgi:Uma2 family endonuclease
MTAARVLNFDGDALSVPVEALDHAGFRRWVSSDAYPEKLRAAFAENEVFVDMNPESIEAHNKVKSALARDLGALVQTEALGEFYSDGALLTNVHAGLSTEPDGMFASWSTLETGRLSPASESSDGIELIGSPDLVIEVVSKSSVRKDTKILRAAYARAGIPEYWMVDARGDELEFQILRLEPGGYVAAGAPTAPQESRVFSRTFRFERRRNRIGRWEYQLKF